MTSLTEAQRNAMLHERVAVLESRIRNQAIFDVTIRQPRIAALEAFISNLWSAYDFATGDMHSAQKLNLRRKLDELGVSVDAWGRDDE